jgi:SAM-dependent methyltransferase
MQVVKRARNVFRAVIQSRGGRFLKARLWNREFASGHWDYIDSTFDDCIYDFLRRYAKRGSILDLGCGAGNTGNELASDAYSAYTGVDISDVAAEKARARSRDNGRAGKNQYFQSDIYSYQPASIYDVILFRESIFYVPFAKLDSMLKRYAQYLAPEGVFIVRMYDRHRYKNIVDLISNTFDMIESYVVPQATTIVLVFQPKDRESASIGANCASVGEMSRKRNREIKHEQS